MCHPELIEKCRKLVDICRGKGLIIGVGECFRTVEEQDRLYAKGRTAPGKIVTNAKGSNLESHHQWGTAFDIYRNDGKGLYYDRDGFFDKVGEIGKNIGLEWGGDWISPVDRTHFQLKYWGSTTEKLKQEFKSFENFKKSWETEMIEMTEKVYNKTEELPHWAKETIIKLIDKGYLAGDGEKLGLTETAIKVFVVNDRAGLY